MTNSTPVDIPRITLSGSPRERGRRYGAWTRERLHRSVNSYRQVFQYYAKWDWPKVAAHARRYLPAIEAFAPSALEEMRGIAEGGGLDFEDVLALNVRSEVMFASGAFTDTGLSSAIANECSSFAVLPKASFTGHTIVGQNWDWLIHARDTVVALDVRRDDGPDFMTLTEAGLLAKTGINAAGVAVCTNTLVSFLDDGPIGVPYHVILRTLLDSESISDAVGSVFQADKAMSANYLLGDADGLAIDLEVTPGGPTSVRVLMPDDDGLLAHTNHFLAEDFARTDSRVSTSPGSLFRLFCLLSRLREAAPAITIEALTGMLSDHRNEPDGVCSHGDPRTAEEEQYATIVSVVYDLDDRAAWVAAGTPCTTDYERYQPEAPDENSAASAAAPDHNGRVMSLQRLKEK